MISAGKPCLIKLLDTYPPRRKARPHLDSFRDVRREMGRVYRDVRAGRVPPQTGTRLVYILQVIARTLEQEQAARDGQLVVSGADEVTPGLTGTQALLAEIIARARHSEAD